MPGYTVAIATAPAWHRGTVKSGVPGASSRSSRSRRPMPASPSQGKFGESKASKPLARTLRARLPRNNRPWK